MAETDKICGIVTESMMYRVGSPLPVPPGYDIEPFVIVGILEVFGNELPRVGADDEQQGPEPEPAPDDKAAAEGDTVVPPPVKEEPPEPDLNYLIFATPDEEELKVTLPDECPEDQKSKDPNWQITWPKAVKYNRLAKRHEADGQRMIVTVSEQEVVRVERVVRDAVFRGIIENINATEEKEQAQAQPNQLQPDP